MRTIPREVRSFEEIKRHFSLDAEQEAVLIGTLLGDASLNKRGNNYRLHIKHAQSQLSLTRFKRTVFANITNMPIRSFTQKVKEKNYAFCEFVTLTHPIFSDYHHLFYPQGKKVITEALCMKIHHPLTLATWFMDDGSSDHAGLVFNTHCFSINELERLQKTLKLVFGITTTLGKNKGKSIIYLPKREVSAFVEMVKPFTLPDFYYKLIPYSQRTP